MALPLYRQHIKKFGKYNAQAAVALPCRLMAEMSHGAGTQLLLGPSERALGSPGAYEGMGWAFGRPGPCTLCSTELLAERRLEFRPRLLAGVPAAAPLEAVAAAAAAVRDRRKRCVKVPLNRLVEFLRAA